MKKFLLTAFVLSIGICVKATDDKFIELLRNCTPYTDSGNVQVSGINAISYKKLEGWNSDRCIYKETINLGGTKFTTTCKFTRPQINEITSVADAYYLTQKYAQDDVDTSSLEILEKNPLAAVFQKYLNDPSVCSVDGM